MTINTTVRLTDDIRARVNALAKARKMAPHAVMVDAIASYVEREEKRESLRQEGKRAFEEFQMTGLHLTGDEMIDWMDRILAGENPELPSCHG